MSRISCANCMKRSGWLLAIPAFALIPKCPLCLLAWFALAGAAVWNHSLLIAAVFVGAILAAWRVTVALRSPCRQRGHRFSGATAVTETETGFNA